MDMKTMSLKDKIAQLFTFSALSSELDEKTRMLITDWKIGGLFLGTGCLDSPEQVHRLTTAAQKISIAEGSGDPLFISADFVAGAGCKLKSGALQFPKNRAIGAGADEGLAYEAGRITAQESLAMGVNFNYSPVTDINNNPLNPVIGTHSFGEDRDEVFRLSNAIIRGYQKHGLIATAKHFPGHGDTSVDSHEDLPVLPFDSDRLRNFELVPFQQAIHAGVDAVMVGHIAVPSIDHSLTPASLSYELTTNLLRKELGFDGLIITDGLSMKGITKKYGMEEACVKALQAGNDILLATTDSFDQAVSMIKAVISAVENGVFSESRIDESLARIERIKRKYGLTKERFKLHKYDPSSFLSDSGKKINAELARKAITELNGISKGVLNVSDFKVGGFKAICDERCSVFTRRLAEHASELNTSTTVRVEDAIELLRVASDKEKILLVTAGSKPIGTVKSTEVAVHLSRVSNAIWVHFGSQYDVTDTDVQCLLMYDFAPSLQNAAADYLIGI